MHLTSLSSYSSQFLRMLLLFVGLTLITSSCSPSDLLVGGAKAVLGGGGGPSVNAQVGKEVIQGVKVTNEAPEVDNSTTNNTVDYWLIALLIIGWLAPSPGEIARGITKLFKGES